MYGAEFADKERIFQTPSKMASFLGDKDHLSPSKQRKRSRKEKHREPSPEPDGKSITFLLK